MKSFQTILLIVFAFFIVGAVLIFSGAIGGNKSQQDALVQSPVIMWGTLPAKQMSSFFQLALQSGDKFNITYVEKTPDNFEPDLIDALAAGSGPDLILAPHTLLLKQQDKLMQIPSSAVPERLFLDSYTEASEVLLTPDYSIALPLYLDPIVMYWNRDMFSRAGLSEPPKTWLEAQLLPEKLTKLDSNGNITESAIALGGVNNIDHFKEILSAQFMQAGNKIVSHNLNPTAQDSSVNEVVLGQGSGADSALRYYIEFANPSLTKYSWNSAKKNSFEEFISGSLGVYFGFASELDTMRQRNPHLNFDTAIIPQITGSNNRLTYADVYALGVLKKSTVSNAALAVAYRMSLGGFAAIISNGLKVAPARRDLLSAGSKDPNIDLFVQSAIIAKTWYDPNYTSTRNIFADMVEDAIIGRASPATSVASAGARIIELLK